RRHVLDREARHDGAGGPDPAAVPDEVPVGRAGGGELARAVHHRPLGASGSGGDRDSGCPPAPSAELTRRFFPHRDRLGTLPYGSAGGGAREHGGGLSGSRAREPSGGRREKWTVHCDGNRHGRSSIRRPRAFGFESPLVRGPNRLDTPPPAVIPTADRGVP